MAALVIPAALATGLWHKCDGELSKPSASFSVFSSYGKPSDPLTIVGNVDNNLGQNHRRTEQERS